MDPSHLLILVPPLLIVVGVALLWLRAAQSPAVVSSHGKAGPRILTAIGWSLLVIGILGTVAIATHVYAVLAVVVTSVLLIAAVRQYYAAECRVLLWTLMTAAERGIPLRDAAQAFASERQDLNGRRAELLADYLDAGLPLALALQRSGHLVPGHIQLAVELGERSGTLGLALRHVVGQTDELENTSRSLLERFFYLVFLVVFTGGMVAFLVIKILPVLRKIFEELGVRLPATTETLIELCRIVALSGPLLALPVLALIIVVVIALRHYLARSARDLTLVRGLWSRAEYAAVLRWLGVAVAQGRSIPDFLRLTAGYVSRRSLRRRLERAAVRIDAGEHWGDSLLQCGLIRRPERAVLQAAERAGNLSWALNEMADGGLRRTTMRLQAWLDVAFPVALLIVAGGIFFVILTVLQPLFSLVGGLS